MADALGEIEVGGDDLFRAPFQGSAHGQEAPAFSGDSPEVGQDMPDFDNRFQLFRAQYPGEVIFVNHPHHPAISPGDLLGEEGGLPVAAVHVGESFDNHKDTIREDMDAILSVPMDAGVEIVRRVELVGDMDHSKLVMAACGGRGYRVTRSGPDRNEDGTLDLDTFLVVAEKVLFRTDWEKRKQDEKSDGE